MFGRNHLRVLAGAVAVSAIAVFCDAVLAAGKPARARPGTAFIAASSTGPVTLSGQQVPASRIEPERFGAQGNGVVDDTVAIQHAIDVAHGRTVWLSANKTYLVTRELRLPSNTTIEGAGPHTVLKFNWFDGTGANSGGKFYIANRPQSNGSSNITLTNFVLQGGGDGQPSGPNQRYPNKLTCGIRLTDVNHFTFSHLEVEDTPGYSLGEFGSSNGTFQYNYIHNSGRGGIGMWWDGRNTDHVTVAHNLVTEVGDDAIAASGLPARPPNHSLLPTAIHVNDNTISGWSTNVNGRILGNGIALYAVKGVTVKNNSITYTFGAGVLVVSCGHTLCPHGPAIRDPSTHSHWRSSNVKVLDNIIRNAGRLYPGSTEGRHGIPTDGVFIGTAASTTVSGNVIKNPLRARVVSRHCSNCSISRKPPGA
jgi:hypothetical protein